MLYIKLAGMWIVHFSLKNILLFKGDIVKCLNLAKFRNCTGKVLLCAVIRPVIRPRLLGSRSKYDNLVLPH